MAKLLRLIMKESIQSASDTLQKIKELINQANSSLKPDVKDVYVVKNNQTNKYDIMMASNNGSSVIASVDYSELPEADLKELNILKEDTTESVVLRDEAEKVINEDDNSDNMKEDYYINVNDGKTEDTDYLIQDVTELEDVSDEDVEAPSMDGLLSLVNESLSEKYGTTWGYLKAHSTAKKENLQYAIIDIVTPSILKEAEQAKIKDKAVSKTIILESVPNSKKLVNLKVNTLAGTTRFSQKTSEPAKVFARWLESEYLYDEMVKDFEEKMQARQQELKASTESYLKEHPDLANRVNVLNAQAKVLKDAKMMKTGKPELQELMYGLVSEFPFNTNVEESKDEYSQSFDTTDKLVEMLFGKEFVKEDTAPDNKVEKTKTKHKLVSTKVEKIKESSSNSGMYINEYFSSLEDAKDAEKILKSKGHKTKIKKSGHEYELWCSYKTYKESSLKEGYESFKIGEIEGTFNPDTLEVMYSIPSENVKDKKINLTKVPSVETPYNTDTIIKDYVEKNYGNVPSENNSDDTDITIDADDVNIENEPSTPEPTPDNSDEEVKEADELPEEPNEVEPEESSEDNQSETGTASFYKIRQREPVSIDDLLDKTAQGTNSQESEYIVVKEQELSEDEMNNLLSNLSKPQSFLQNVESIDRKNYAFNVVKVTSPNSQYTLLIDSVGYDYPRYVAVQQ